MERLLSTVLLAALLAAGPGRCQESVAGPAPGERADIEERVGAVLPGDLVFTDAEGIPRQLSSLLTRPTILALVFYRCPGICNAIQESLASALSEIPEKGGTDYTALVLSFDETDTPEDSRRKLHNARQVLGPEYPSEGLQYLTGDRASIEAVLAATGFHVIRQDGDFVHSGALIVMAPGGKIVRYVHGSQYLPPEVSLALAEAKAGRPGFSVRRLASVCVSGDPESRRQGLAVLRVGGLAVTVGLLGVLAFMLGFGRRKKS
jgi:protein SCO1/2